MKNIPNNPEVYGLLSNCVIKGTLFVSIPTRSKPMITKKQSLVVTIIYQTQTNLKETIDE